MKSIDYNLDRAIPAAPVHLYFRVVEQVYYSLFPGIVNSLNYLFPRVKVPNYSHTGKGIADFCNVPISLGKVVKLL